jgi:hypothetical protein
MRKKSRAWLTLGLGVALFAASVIAASPAEAGVLSNTDPYDLVWTQVSPGLGLCVTYEIVGSFTYTTSANPTGHSWYIKGIVNRSPKFTVTSHPYAPTYGCYSSTVSMQKIDVSQHWSGYACSYNPSISFGFPFAVGASFWPSCGTRDQATYASSYGAGATHTQFNTTALVGFAEVQSYGSIPAGPCYGAYVNGQPYFGGNSDPWVAPSSKKVCLTPTWG